MVRHRLIGLLGPKGAGKSTVADYLTEHYGAYVYSFASPLKEIIRLAFDMKREQLYGTQEQKETVDPRYNVSPRWLMTRIGTEGVRQVLGKNFWIEQTLRDIGSDACELAVVDDVRFLNEAQYVRMGYDVDGREGAGHGVVWLLDPRGYMTPEQAEHESEADWVTAPCDEIIRPERRDLDLLYRLVDEKCAKIGLRKKGQVTT